MSKRSTVNESNEGNPSAEDLQLELSGALQKNNFPVLDEYSSRRMAKMVRERDFEEMMNPTDPVLRIQDEILKAANALLSETREGQLKEVLEDESHVDIVEARRSFAKKMPLATETVVRIRQAIKTLEFSLLPPLEENFLLGENEEDGNDL